MEENKNLDKSSEKEVKKPAAKPDHESIKEEIVNDLNNNPKYKSFFNGYNSRSVESFKNYYASDKALAVLHGEMYEGIENSYILRYKEMAEDHLWRIQQRKLFDLQCKWRAEEISLKEVTIAIDFKVWEKKIDECPFLTPISQDEFDLYMEFAEKSDYDDVIDKYVQEWQEYEDFKEQYFNEDSDDYFELRPMWYEFYELKTGLSTLYLLSDIRGKKEEFYCNLSRENDRKKSEDANGDKPTPAQDTRPELDYYDEESAILFMEKFEDAKTIDRIQAFIRETRHLQDEDLYEAMETLQHAEPYTPVNFNEDWRDGIIQAAGEYTKKKLIEELPKAYNNYLFRIKNGLGFELGDKKGNDFLREIYVELILDGRKLNGEPEDFNF